MRTGITLILFSLCVTLVYGQTDSSLFLNEFSVSVNRTNLKDDNTDSRFGFGIGVYHSSMSGKKINVIAGFEFNRTSQFKKNIYGGHYTNLTDVTYYFNYLSIPLAVRINFGKKTKLFLEAGAFLELNAGARSRGTMKTYFPDQDNQIVVYTETKFNDKTNVAVLNYGPSAGIGLKIPFAKHVLIIKTDYKYGLNELSDDLDQILNRYVRLMIGLKI